MDECEPLRLGVAPVFDLDPMLCPTNCREDGEGEDRLQGVQRGRMLAAWVVDNGEKSKYLVNRSGLGHEAILCLRDGVERVGCGR